MGDDKERGQHMELVLKGRHMDVSDRMHDYAEKRFGRLERFLDDEPARLEVVLIEEKNPKIEDRARVKASLSWRSLNLRAEEASPDVYASLDLAADKLLRQVRKEHEKRVERWKGGRNGERRKIGEIVDRDLKPIHEDLVPNNQRNGMAELNIHRTKQFNVGPMTAEDAAAQMELVGHEFFVFKDADTGSTNVLYKRSDGDFGLIEPAVEEESRSA